MPHPRGWHNRGYLPHADFSGLCQAVTFRLADSLPRQVLEKIQSECANASTTVDEERRNILLRERIHDFLDQGYGHCVLTQPACRDIMAALFHHYDEKWYQLHAYTIMPNHIHVLLSISTVPLSKIIGQWKGAGSRAINVHCGTTGHLWQREYVDRFIRDEHHFHNALEYIRQNPVRAKLCAKPEQWLGTWIQQAG